MLFLGKDLNRPNGNPVGRISLWWRGFYKWKWNETKFVINETWTIKISRQASINGVGILRVGPTGPVELEGAKGVFD